MSEKKKASPDGVAFYRKPWFVWLMIVIFFPVGLRLLWKYNMFDRLSRIAVCVLVILLFMTGMNCIDLYSRIDKLQPAAVSSSEQTSDTASDENQSTAEDDPAAISAIKDEAQNTQDMKIPELQPKNQAIDSGNETKEIIGSDNEASIVYYTPSGTVYHLYKDCPSISRSQTIIEGTIEQASKAGKQNVCKRCKDRQ